jgi:predicted nucleotidyltransferase component of viral defense system
MTLEQIRQAYIEDGLSYLEATQRTGQDVVLHAIASSSLARNVTIKGGVVMQHISGDDRRATQDIDFDFIKYSLGDDSIKAFISKLNSADGDITIEQYGAIDELKQQDYHGKRVYIRIADKAGTSIETKLDIGVHNDISIEQEEYCFDLSKMDDSITLLINTKEQVITEKLKSLLRIGAVSTRYKDVFDVYYIIENENVDKAALEKCFEHIIYSDERMRERDMASVHRRLTKVLQDRRFSDRLKQSRRSNWIEADTDTVITAILAYFKP